LRILKISCTFAADFFGLLANRQVLIKII